MEDLRKLKSKISIISNRLKLISVILVISVCFLLELDNTYAVWYEEPPVYETKNLNDMWWVSSKKKEEIKKKQQIELNKQIEENKHKEFKDKKIKWIYNELDIDKFPKNQWEIIDDDNDSIGYNYCFDKDGYLYIDTITPDYKIVDGKGREVDNNFIPIEYQIRKENTQEIIVETENDKLYKNEISNIILDKGLVFKNKTKIYDSSINKNLNDYIEKSDRYLKDIKATIYNKVRWKNCSSLKGNGGYVIFTNPNNNFNKITGIIAVQDSPYEDDTTYTLKVYDQDEYDKYEEYKHFYDLYEIYENDSFNKSDAITFSFTFDRSIKRLRFEIETVDDYNSRTCYFKDLKFGFSKQAFKEELIRKKDNDEDIDALKELGINIYDLMWLESLDENGELIYKDNEETENENNDDNIGGISYISEEETKSYEDVVRDRNTGPAFDESLQNIKEIGPGFINTE